MTKVTVTSYMPYASACNLQIPYSYSLQEMLQSDRDRLTQACTPTTGLEPIHYCWPLTLINPSPLD
jgi:hypothetical protein